MSNLPPSLRNAPFGWWIPIIVGCILGLCAFALSLLPQRWMALGALIVVAPFLAMIVGRVRRLLLAIVLLEIPIQLDVNLFYRGEAASLGAIGGLNISVMTLCLLVLYLMWLVELLTRKVRPPEHLFLLSLPALVYFGFVALSLIAAQDLALAGFELFLLFQALLVYVYLVGTVRTKEEIRFVVTFIVAGLFLQGSIMIALGLTGSTFDFVSIASRVDSGQNGLRVAGTIGSPIGAAAYLSLLLAPTFSVLVTNVGLRLKVLAALAFGSGVIALLMTQSRGAWVSFTLSMTLLFVFTFRRGWLPRRVAAPVILFGLVLILLFQGQIVGRLLGDDQGSALSRIPLVQLAWEIIQAHPILGVGANNFTLAFSDFLTPRFNDVWIFTIHNQYLLVWLQTGIFSLAAFLWFLLSILHRGWRNWRQRDRLTSTLSLAFAAAVLGQMFHMMVDIFNSRPSVQMLWVVAALVTLMNRRDVRVGGRDRAAGIRAWGPADPRVRPPPRATAAGRGDGRDSGVHGVSGKRGPVE